MQKVNAFTHTNIIYIYIYIYIIQKVRLSFDIINVCFDHISIMTNVRKGCTLSFLPSDVILAFCMIWF